MSQRRGGGDAPFLTLREGLKGSVDVRRHKRLAQPPLPFVRARGPKLRVYPAPGWQPV